MINSDKYLEEINFTYRKIKRELFNNKDTTYFERIIKFEENYDYNVAKLNSLLISFFNDLDDLNKIINSIEVGNSFNTLKKITFNKRDKKVHSKVIDNNIELFSHSLENFKKGKFNINKIEYRNMGDFSVEFQIIAGIWVNHIGYLLESKMSDSSFGCRLKEVKNVDNYKENHTYYRPYFNDYKNWQEKLIDQITECDCSDELLIITTDFSDFFNSINLDKLQEFITDEINEHENYEFNLKLNKLLFHLIEKFKTKNCTKGLPLNLICSGALANTYLIKFDTWINDKLKPLYYGRYVDDILLAVDLKDEFAQRIVCDESNCFNKLNEEFFKGLENLGIKLNNNKTKIFPINKSEKNKFKQLKEHLNSTSSEWRLIPSTEKYDTKLINESDLFLDNYSSSNLLKENYNLSTRRNYFIKELLGFEKTYFIMEKAVWKKRLSKLLEVLEDVIFDLKNFQDFQKQIPRVIGLLVQTNDKTLISSYFKQLNELLSCLDDYLNDNIEHEKQLNNSFIKHLKNKSSEYITYFTPVEKNNDFLNEIPEFKKFFQRNLISVLSSKNYFSCDLHFEPLSNSFYKYDEYQNYLIKNHNLTYIENVFFTDSEKKFISKNLKSNSCEKFHSENECDCENENNCIEIYDTSGFYFFTRRISLLELTIAFKNKILDPKECKIIQSLASKYYSKYKGEVQIEKYRNELLPNNVKEIRIDSKDSNKYKKEKTVVCNTHYLTNDDSYFNSLHLINNNDSERVDRIINLVNDIIKSNDKIDYIVFHELSIPRSLYITLSKKLSLVKINLIAGLEYKHDKSNLSVDNQLIYVLNTNKDYNESIALYQSKVLPAIHEEREIREKIGYSMDAKFKDRLIINHNGFVFNGMICNDLINIDNRAFLRGNIDCLFVLAWNTDIGMYEHLVQTTSFDTHSYVLLCNNRKYGDSHIFVPYSKNYMRYLQRINGGKKDNFMISEIDVIELRTFQLNKISPAEPFKPIPTGFSISETRINSLKDFLNNSIKF